MAETRRGTYTGPLPNMKGRTAQVTIYDPRSGRCMAEFEGDAGYLGPHDFALDHFELEADDDAKGA